MADPFSDFGSLDDDEIQEKADEAEMEGDDETAEQLYAVLARRRAATEERRERGKGKQVGFKMANSFTDDVACSFVSAPGASWIQADSFMSPSLDSSQSSEGQAPDTVSINKKISSALSALKSNLFSFTERPDDDPRRSTPSNESLSSNTTSSPSHFDGSMSEGGAASRSLGLAAGWFKRISTDEAAFGMEMVSALEEHTPPTQKARAATVEDMEPVVRRHGRKATTISLADIQQAAETAARKSSLVTDEAIQGHMGELKPVETVDKSCLPSVYDIQSEKEDNAETAAAEILQERKRSLSHVDTVETNPLTSKEKPDEMDLAGAMRKLSHVETEEKVQLPTAADIEKEKGGEVEKAAEIALQEGKEALKQVDTQVRQRLPSIAEIDAEKTAGQTAAEILMDAKYKLLYVETEEKLELPPMEAYIAEKKDKSCSLISSEDISLMRQKDPRCPEGLSLDLPFSRASSLNSVGNTPANSNWHGSEMAFSKASSTATLNSMVTGDGRPAKSRTQTDQSMASVSESYTTDGDSMTPTASVMSRLNSSGSFDLSCVNPKLAFAAQKEKPLNYGLDSECKAKQDAKFDPVLEQKVTAWIEAITGPLNHRNGESLQAWLKDGHVLCNLVNCIKPGSVKQVNESSMPFKEMENIVFFMNAARKLGVPESSMFGTPDLYEGKNMVSVTRGIYVFGCAVQVSVPEFTGPKLGVALSTESKDKKRGSKIRMAKSQTQAFTNTLDLSMGSAGRSQGGQEGVFKEDLCYGLDADLKAKQDAKYDKGLESEVITWIETVTGEKRGEESVHGWLKDGQILCSLANKVKPGSVKKVNESSLPFKEMENITFFMNAVRDIGVPETSLFGTPDLYEEKNMGSVLSCIYTYGGAIQVAIPSFTPKLGVALHTESKDRKRNRGPLTDGAAGYSSTMEVARPTNTGITAHGSAPRDLWSAARSLVSKPP